MTAITAGQIYQSCNPRDVPPIRIRIESYRPGAPQAHVVDAVTGKRFRQILVARLHASGLTRNGAPRRTGYRLVHKDLTA